MFSYKVCGITVAADGTEDDMVHCLKAGQPCAAGKDVLQQARVTEAVVAMEEEEDEGETFENENLIEEDGSDDEVERNENVEE